MESVNLIGSDPSKPGDMDKLPLGKEKANQFYYGHGKLLLTGEYFVMEGAKSLALPLKVGQSMSVRYSQSFEPKLYWKSFDVHGNLWMEAHYEFWHFECTDENPTPEALELQKLLRQARSQNSHFLRDEFDVFVETRLGFPLEWGLGSSSTLIHNLAQWAYTSPFELLFNTQGGSGYDIACAQSEGPIVYTKDGTGQVWGPVQFAPDFTENLYFMYLGHKQKTHRAIEDFKNLMTRKIVDPFIPRINEITESILNGPNQKEFNSLLEEHEKIVSSYLERPTVKEEKFSDFPGTVKSLGAWGGDFVLLSSELSKEELRKFFPENEYRILIPYQEIVLKDFKQRGQLVSMESNGLLH